jgi:hypothetical protein
MKTNGIEDTDTNPHNYSHLIFNKGAQNMQRRKDSLFNKWCWENWISTYRRLKLYPSLPPCTSINSKWIKALNVRSEMAKLIQEKLGNTLDHIGPGNNFMNRTPIAHQLRERTDKWDCMKPKSCTVKEIVTRLKSELAEWEKIFASYTSDK